MHQPTLAWVLAWVAQLFTFSSRPALAWIVHMLPQFQNLVTMTERYSDVTMVVTSAGWLLTLRWFRSVYVGDRREATKGIEEATVGW